MYYLGTDYHKSFSYCTMIDEQGRIIKQGKIKDCAEDVKLRRGVNKAKVATLRKLLTIVYCVLKENGI